MPAETPITLRRLVGEPDDMRDLQRVMAAAPRYAQLVTGVPPGPADAQSLCTMLPEGKTYDDKFVLGVFSDGMMVGCVDLIRGWPDAATAHLGLLLIAESHEDRGLGRSACRLIEQWARQWPGIVRLRLGVLHTNDRALRFWALQGFAPNGEVKPWRCGTVEADIRVMVKALEF